MGRCGSDSLWGLDWAGRSCRRLSVQMRFDKVEGSGKQVNAMYMLSLQWDCLLYFWERGKMEGVI